MTESDLHHPQLTGTPHRNDTAHLVPANLFVAFFSKFKAKPYFKADEGASKAPEVFKD